MQRVEMEYADIDRDSLSPTQRFSYDYGSAALARMENEVEFSSSALLSRAKDALGTPYVFGGTSLNGFDCSGFVQWAYRNVGISLPRTAREQSAFGVPVEMEDMVAGDIVTFRHPRRGYHTGIYVGDGKFIHSPRPRKDVRIASLSDPYFSKTFTGARRVAFSEEVDSEIAQSLLDEYNKTPKVTKVQKKASAKKAKKKSPSVQAQKQKSKTKSSNLVSSKNKSGK